MKQQILVVDDERPVLDSLRRMLHSHRNVWELTLVEDPRAALERLSRETGVGDHPRGVGRAL
jgi:CheY-like chemotaxis protein